MKRFLFYPILLLIFISVFFIIILSLIGFETNKFNKLISDKVYESKNIILELEKIKFKLDPQELSLFLETKSPKITFRSKNIPVKNIKIYVDFLSLFQSLPKINKTNITLEELDINQLNKLSTIIKPSNFKSILNNRITGGKVMSEIEIFLNKEGLVKDFIAKGSVRNLKVELINNLYLKDTSLSFFADKNDILIKKIFGNIEDISVFDGDIRLNLENGINLKSNFNSKLNFNERNILKYSKFLNKYEFLKNIKTINANLNNSLSVDLDETYKVIDYNYILSGKVSKSELELSSSFKNSLINEEINKIYFKDLEIKSIFSSKNSQFICDGQYSLNNQDFLKINLENNLIKNNMNLNLYFDYINNFEIDLINYKKSKKKIANLSLNLQKTKDILNVNNFSFIEGKNLIEIEGLKFKNKNFLSFKKINVKTPNNNFSVQNENKILVTGAKFDATRLMKYFDKKSSKNNLQNLSSKIEIDFKNIKVPMSEKLENFKLIGEIEKGKFNKITSKGDFGGNNFLDISLKRDKISKTKYLEIYSDLTRPLLTDYSFFRGLSGGKLLFTSIIEENKSVSKLKIEDFKLVNAPGVIKLLSLADLGGLADLAEGEGLSFDLLEINMQKTKDLLELNEILALGPSMSVLMQGYQSDDGLTSLRGTLVPAKTLNKIISKIPLIGNIVIPKEVGEGLFGVSFKMKGTKGKIKTTINPIRTLTPRFLQKIIDKNKEAK
tara:strand:+ start:6388 stop:8559 length:2172 start_codon:yes stop_codon:yes gene_type:complete